MWHGLKRYGEESQTQNFNINNINEVIMQTQKYSFYGDLNKQAERKRGKSFERWKVYDINKVKQWEIVLSFKVSLFVQFIQP